jgi:hypothetical protein
VLSGAGQAQAQRYYAREKVMKTADAPAKPATASTCSLTSPNVVYTYTGSVKVLGQKSMPFSGNPDTVRSSAKDLCESFAESTACEAFTIGGTLYLYAYAITGGKAEYRSDQNYGRTYPWAGACVRS